MKTLISVWILLLLAAPGLAAPDPAKSEAPAPTPQEHLFNAADGLRLHGYYYQLEKPEHPLLILAFHQARGDGRGEYGPIAAQLNREGYELFAVDQRSGGNLFGGINQTVADAGRSSGYCEAYPDLKAAYSYLHAMRPKRPIVIVGSSYSAALVLRLAAEHPPMLAGVLSFSPASGGPLEECRGEDVSDQITVPVFIARPRQEMQYDSVKAQAKIFEGQGHEVYVANPGVHGASMLVADRVGANVDATWSAVRLFLRNLEAKD